MANTKHMSKKILLSLAAIAVIAMGAVSALPKLSKAEPSARKIVIFDSSATDKATQEKLIAKVGGVKIKNLPLVNGAAVVLPTQADLKGVAGILRVDEDAEVTALGKPAPAPAPQTIPWARIWSGKPLPASALRLPSSIPE